ncbi:MAG: hypothetical protein AAB394_04165 [Patescibacteria group bacterium]
MGKIRGTPFVHTYTLKIYFALITTLAAGPLAPATDRMSAG